MHQHHEEAAGGCGGETWACRGRKVLCRPDHAILRGFLLARGTHPGLRRETGEAGGALRLLTLLCVHVGTSDTAGGELKPTESDYKALGIEERLRESVLLSLDKRRLWGEGKHLIAVAQYLRGGHQQDGARLFTVADGGRMGDKRTS